MMGMMGMGRPSDLKRETEEPDPKKEDDQEPAKDFQEILNQKTTSIIPKKKPKLKLFGNNRESTVSESGNTGSSNDNKSDNPFGSKEESPSPIKKVIGNTIPIEEEPEIKENAGSISFKKTSTGQSTITATFDEDFTRPKSNSKLKTNLFDFEDDDNADNTEQEKIKTSQPSQFAKGNAAAAKIKFLYDDDEN